MAKKKEITEEIKLLKSRVDANTAIIGKEKVMKELKNKNLTTIFLAGNCESKTREDIKHLANLANVKVVELEQSNEELGVICKKNFFISVLGISGD
ncbi:50S ribosomal protein L30 [Candidatus Woesearchaeota archaeon]|nr:50S ribosomal protein L30 [Candidatus Woesearchaeota archaeon]